MHSMSLVEDIAACIHFLSYMKSQGLPSLEDCIARQCCDIIRKIEGMGNLSKTEGVELIDEFSKGPWTEGQRGDFCDMISRVCVQLTRLYR